MHQQQQIIITLIPGKEMQVEVKGAIGQDCLALTQSLRDQGDKTSLTYKDEFALDGMAFNLITQQQQQ